jgi:hypothetical protein
VNQSGQYVHVLAFGRIDCTLSAVDRTTGLTLE